jgi:hypothetical protein
MLFYLANHFKGIGEFEMALEYANKLSLIGGVEK